MPVSDVEPWIPGPGGEKGNEGGWLDERAGTGEVSASAGAGFRLCTLGAQSSCTPQRTVPARGGEGAYRERNRILGDYLFQALQEPDPGDRTSAGDSGFDVGKRPLSRLLSGNDLRGFPCGR